jgi:hypothetical protein
MHRRPLLDMLARYRDAFPGEADVVDRISALVESHIDCFERTCRPGHITGAAWILSSDRRRCLLTHHRKLDRWLQLGGHADGPIEGVLMPLDLDVHHIPARHDAEGHVVEDAHEHHDIRFLLIAHAGQEICISDESHDLGWFTPDEVLELTDEESVLRMLHKTLELLG